MKFSITLIIIFLIASHLLVYTIADNNVRDSITAKDNIQYRPIPIDAKLLTLAMIRYDVDVLGYDGKYFYLDNGVEKPIITDEFCEYAWGNR